MQRIIISFLQVFTGFTIFSQELIYSNYNTSNGLPSSEIYDLEQDYWNNLWICTDRGLCKYDGYEFKDYGSHPKLKGKTVLKLFKDPLGHIWVMTMNQELYIIDGKTGKIQDFPYNSQLQNFGNNLGIWELYFFKKELYLTYTFHKGFLRFSSKGLIENTLDKIDKENSIETIVASRDLNCFTYLTDEKQGQRYLPDHQNRTIVKELLDDRKSDRPTSIILKNGDVFTSLKKGFLRVGSNGERESFDLGFEVLGIQKLKKDKFVVFTISGGAFIFDQNGRQLFNLLPGLSVTSMIEDHENRLWLSTIENGLFFTRNLSVNRLNFLGKTLKISDIEIDHNDGLWVATNDGDVYKKSHSSLHLDLIYTGKLGRQAKLLALKDELVYNSDYTNFYHYSKQNCRARPARSLGSCSKENADSIYIYWSAGLSKIQKDSRENREDIIKGLRLNAGLWLEGKHFIASTKGVKQEIDGKLLPVFSNHDLLDARLNDIRTIKGNLLAVATFGNGLVLFNDSIAFQVGTQQGLISDYVFDIEKENDSTLWLSTNKGLSSVKLGRADLVEIHNFTYKHGLPSNEISCTKMQNDTLWVGSRDGLCYFTRDFIDKTVHNSYQLRIQKCLINNISKNFNKVQDLSYFENRLSVAFSGVSFNPVEPVKYRYRLNGLEKNWNYTVSGEVTYPSIPPGSYSFEVEMLGDNDYWTAAGRKIQVIISPPFWRSWWFRLALALVIIGLIYLFFRYRILSYNRDILREILRQFLKRLKREVFYITVRESGYDVKIKTEDIRYVQSSGNYIEIYTEKGKHVIREKIGAFLDLVPDKIEFLRVRRSHIVRIDKITKKGKKSIMLGKDKIVVGETYLNELDKIHLN